MDIAGREGGRVIVGRVDGSYVKPSSIESFDAMSSEQRKGCIHFLVGFLSDASSAVDYLCWEFCDGELVTKSKITLENAEEGSRQMMLNRHRNPVRSIAFIFCTHHSMWVVFSVYLSAVLRWDC